jgi:hypothetical protein
MTNDVALYLVEDFRGTEDKAERLRKQLLYYHLILQAIASGYGFPNELATIALALKET